MHGAKPYHPDRNLKTYCRKTSKIPFSAADINISFLHSQIVIHTRIEKKSLGKQKKKCRDTTRRTSGLLPPIPNLTHNLPLFPHSSLLSLSLLPIPINQICFLPPLAKWAGYHNAPSSCADHNSQFPHRMPSTATNFWLLFLSLLLYTNTITYSHITYLKLWLKERLEDHVLSQVQ